MQAFESNTPRHFNDNPTATEETLEIHKHAVLVIDSASYTSYTTTSYATSTVITGDFSGFLLAVEPKFDPAEGASRPDESPGYSGQVRILGSLIWSDMYPLLQSQSSRLEDMWPLAMEHPNQVYVGPTVPWQLFLWRKQNATRNLLLHEVVEYAKKKLGVETPNMAPESATAAVAQASPESRISGGAENTPPYSREDLLMYFDAALRTRMRAEFLAFLRSSDHPHHAALAGEMMLLGPGEEPDLERLRQRLDEVDQELVERKGDGSSSESSDGQ